MKILFASDHAGFELKNTLLKYARSLGYKTEDMGSYEFDEEDDYPDYIAPLARRIAEGDSASAPSEPPLFGVILGGSGQGEAICANKFPSVRASVFYGGNLEIIRLSRAHNDSNILSFGARFLSEEEAKKALKLWLETHFSEDERHERRLKKLEDLKQ